uniref:Apple domain-containing protein n=1 Tax=Anopheles farauti TaxID=69004 RepID=A0A182QWK0_9DIPT
MVQIQDLGALTKSQFPVFTIYAQKSCLKLRPCERAWCIDRVQGYKLNGHVKRTAQVVSRRDCIEMCLGENEFTCRHPPPSGGPVSVASRSFARLGCAVMENMHPVTFEWDFRTYPEHFTPASHRSGPPGPNQNIIKEVGFGHLRPLQLHRGKASQMALQTPRYSAASAIGRNNRELKCN